MRKYTLILLLAVCSVCFAQNSTQIKVDLNRIEVRLNGKLKISKKPLYTFLIIRKKRIELYKELFVNIDKNMYLRPAVGFEYNFITNRISAKTRLDFIGNFDKIFFNIIYGSDLSQGVSTRLEYKFTKKFLVGFQSLNENIGPRIDYQFEAFHDKKFTIGTYYLIGNNFGFSFRFDILTFFPKWRNTKKEFEYWIN